LIDIIYKERRKEERKKGRKEEESSNFVGNPFRIHIPEIGNSTNILFTEEHGSILHKK